MSVERPKLTIGIEEEYQIVDPKTRELTSYITQFLDGPKAILRQHKVMPELHQSQVEIGTEICRTPAEARRELIRLRKKVCDFARERGLRIIAAGTHPITHWSTQEITPLERYSALLEHLQDIARKSLIFGMHVHIGIENKDFIIDVMNTLRYMLPHLLALSTSSPFSEGRNTGLKSYRTILFRSFPRAGIPYEFQSYSEYNRFVKMMVKANSIEDASKLWWDVRPHHKYPTLEFRVCDLCTNVDDAICIAAIFQALVMKHYVMRMHNTTFRHYPHPLIDENKWRAARFGIEGNLIDFGRESELPAKQLIVELVEFVDDVLDDLGTRAEVEHAYEILKRGTSADRQLKIYEETGDLHAVVDWLIEETMRGCE